MKNKNEGNLGHLAMTGYVVFLLFEPFSHLVVQVSRCHDHDDVVVVCFGDDVCHVREIRCIFSSCFFCEIFSEIFDRVDMIYIFLVKNFFEFIEIFSCSVDIVDEYVVKFLECFSEIISKLQDSACLMWLKNSDNFFIGKMFGEGLMHSVE